MGERFDIHSVSFRDLQRMTEREKGNFRFKNGKMYVSTAGKSNVIKRVFDQLSGYTRAKRSAGVTAVQVICNRYHLSFSELMTAAGCSKQDVKDLQAGRRDLTDEQLHQALSRFVQIGDKAYALGDTIGKGGFGEVRVAVHKNERIALKTFIPPIGGDLSKLPKKRRCAADVFRKEVEIHRFASQRQLAGEPNHVMTTQAVVEGPEGVIYQPMPLAYASAPDLMEQLLSASPSGEPLPLTQSILDRQQNDPLVVLRWRDQIDGLRQIGAASLAHRDVKSANFLLDHDGVWKLTDFGTSGAKNSLYQATPGKPNSLLTGNDNSYAKSPEWLQHEHSESSARFNVGSECDVFAYGVMVFEDLTNGRRPFDGTKEAPNTWLGLADYGDSVLDYAKSGLAFSVWYHQHTGLTIPQKWQPLLDAALRADPVQRATAEELRRLDAFQDPQLHNPQLRRDMMSAFAKKT